MKPGLISALLLGAALGLPAAAADAPVLPGKNDTAAAIALRRVAERYALTKARISTLLDQKQNPVPLPSNLPNPFYRSPDLPGSEGGRGGPGAPVPSGSDPAAVTEAPAEPDVSDAGTLAKYISAMKVSGLTILKDVLHLTINQTLCKTGDVIPVDVKGHTVYIQVKAITPDELTLRLNEEEQVVHLRR